MNVSHIVARDTSLPCIAGGPCRLSAMIDETLDVGCFMERALWWRQGTHVFT